MQVVSQWWYIHHIHLVTMVYILHTYGWNQMLNPAVHMLLLPSFYTLVGIAPEAYDSRRVCLCAKIAVCASQQSLKIKD